MMIVARISVVLLLLSSCKSVVSQRPEAPDLKQKPPVEPSPKPILQNPVAPWRDPVPPWPEPGPTVFPGAGPMPPMPAPTPAPMPPKEMPMPRGGEADMGRMPKPMETRPTEPVVAPGPVTNPTIPMPPPTIRTLLVSQSQKRDGKATFLFDVINASEMYITSAAECKSGGSWEAFAKAKDWSIDLAKESRIYVKFRSSAETDCRTITYLPGRFWSLPQNVKGNNKADTSAGGSVFHNGKSLFFSNYRGGLSVSDDAGVSWRHVTAANGLAANTVNRVQGFDGKIFVSTASGLSISADGGKSWVTKTERDGLPRADIFSVQKDGDLLYAVTEVGLWVSKDQGQSWTGIRNPYNYGTTKAVISGPDMYVAGGLGLSISRDAGKTWELRKTSAFAGGRLTGVAWDGVQLYVGSAEGLCISKDAGKNCDIKLEDNGLISNWVTGVRGEGPAIYVYSYSGLSVSHDKGVSWKTMHREQVFDLHALGDSLYVTTDRGLKFSSNGGAAWNDVTIAEGFTKELLNSVWVHDGVILASSDSGIFASIDDGKHWSALPLPRRVYHFSKVVANASGMLFGIGIQGLYLSKDEGRNWEKAIQDLSDKVVDIAVDGTLVTAISAKNLFISKENGAIWSRAPRTNGFPSDKELNSLARNDGKIYLAAEDGIHVSPDEGQNWQKLGGPKEVQAMAFADQAIYAAARDELKISRDQGKTWQTLFAGEFALADLELEGDFIYLASDRGLLVSRDAAKSWTLKAPADGLGSESVLSVFADGKTVYAATTGGLSVLNPKLPVE